MAERRMFVHSTSDEELVHLTDYVQRIEDTKLTLRMERAMHDNALARTDYTRNLDNDAYAIVDLPHYAENRYGVHLKRTNDFGIYSFFVFDDGRVSYTCYRSDPGFEREELLQPLRAVAQEMEMQT